MEERTIFIKPCPRCGSTAGFERFGISEHVATITCHNPECGFAMIRSGMSREEATDKAVNAWNRREAEA